MSDCQCWLQDQSWSRLFLVFVLMLLFSCVQSNWDFHFCARSWSRHLWSRTQHCSILCILSFSSSTCIFSFSVLGSSPVLISTFSFLGLGLGLGLGLDLYIQHFWDFQFCAWYWSQHLWSRTQHWYNKIHVHVCNFTATRTGPKKSCTTFLKHSLYTGWPRINGTVDTVDFQDFALINN